MFYQPPTVAKTILTFEAPKLDFRHSDNINHFFTFVRDVGLPEVIFSQYLFHFKVTNRRIFQGFIFELTDLYEKKNLPKVIYCIHALRYLISLFPKIFVSFSFFGQSSPCQTRHGSKNRKLAGSLALLGRSTSTNSKRSEGGGRSDAQLRQCRTRTG